MAPLVFANIDDAILEPILGPDHAEWLRTAGLRQFAALKWNDRDIPRDDLLQFLANYSGDKSTINGGEVDLSCEALCRIFRLGDGKNNAYKRPLGWISKVAPSAAKSPNGYLMSSLPRPLSARCAFLKATLHLVQKAPDASMSIVRQAEEPDSGWDWGTQFVDKLKQKWKLHSSSLDSGSTVSTASHIRIILMHHRMRVEKGPAADDIPGDGASSSEDAGKRKERGSSINSGSGNSVPLSKKRRKDVHLGECSRPTTPTLNPESAQGFQHNPATTSQQPGMKSAPEQVEEIIRQCTTDQTKTAASLGPVGRPEVYLIGNTQRRVVQALEDEHNIYRRKKMTQNGRESVDLRVVRLEYDLSKAHAELKGLDEAPDAGDILKRLPKMVEALSRSTGNFLSTNVDLEVQPEPEDREQRAADGLRQMKVVQDRKQVKDGAELYMNPTTRISELEENNAKVIQELQRFIDGLAVCGVSDVNKLKDKIVELETGVSDGVHKVKKLKLEFDAKCKEVSDLTTELGDFRKSDEAKGDNIQSLEKELEQRQQKEKQLLHDLEKAGAMVNSLKQAQKKLKLEMESLRKDAASQAERITTASIDFDAKCKEVSDLTTKVGDFQESDEAKSSNIQSLEKELEKRQRKEKQLLHDLEKAGAMVNSLQQAEKKLKLEMESLRKDAASQAERITTASVGFDAKCKELSDLTTKVGHFQESDEAQSSRIQLLEKELEERKQTEKQLLHDLEKDRATVNSLHQAAQETEKKLKSEVESLRNDAASRAERITTASVDFDAKCKELSELTTKVGHFQESDEAKSGNIQLLDKELEERKQTEKQLLHDLEKAGALVNSLHQAAQETEKKHQEAIDGLVKREKYAGILQQKAEEQLVVARRKINDNEDLQSRLDFALDHIEDCVQTIQSQSETNDDLRAELRKRVDGWAVGKS